MFFNPGFTVYVNACYTVYLVFTAVKLPVVIFKPFVFGIQESGDCASLLAEPPAGRLLRLHQQSDIAGAAERRGRNKHHEYR